MAEMYCQLHFTTRYIDGINKNSSNIDFVILTDEREIINLTKSLIPLLGLMHLTTLILIGARISLKHRW